MANAGTMTAKIHHNASKSPNDRCEKLFILSTAAAHQKNSKISILYFTTNMKFEFT